MRKLLLLAAAALLLPAGAAAQKVPPVKAAPVKITEAQATQAALAQVRGDLARGLLKDWSSTTGRSDGGGAIPPASVSSQGALFNPTGGKNGVFVVGIRALKKGGHVRVIVDAATGAVLGSQVASWDWGNAPSYWKQGLNSPPPARTNSPPPARSN